GAAAATALDGYQICLKGRGGEAIGTATLTSFLGTFAGMLAMVTAIPLLIKIALNFTSVEFFLLALFGVLICGSLTSPDTPLKGWISGFLGLLMATVGIDPLQGYYRFTFGITDLFEGFEVIPVILGGFAFPQIVRSLRNPAASSSGASSITRVLPRGAELRKYWWVIIRSGLVGVGIGSIPGAGEDIAAWMSYDIAKKASKEPEKFGKGTMEGVISAETANNSCIGGALIPLLTLGVPGSPPAAMLLGAIWLHGVRPGPMLSFEFPTFIPQMAATLFWASFTMLICGFAMSKLTIRVLRIPPAIFMPIVAFFSVMGSYALGLRIFNVQMMFLFGILAYLMEEMGYPIAPLVIGIILGPMADANLRRALIVSQGSIIPFFTRPVALVLLVLIFFSVVSQLEVYRKFRQSLFKGLWK
ncbi:MAG: tripartite tricarboxylate transporter permease, partial [Deltaproteobacteria bacterium]|nr:tripartite tricarboxylate transporter permease [Deltaproteobacteria bacterium]